MHVIINTMSSRSIRTLPCFFYIIITFFYVISHLNVSAAQTTVVKSAYWFPASGQSPSAINATLFTHLFCAFADLDPTTFQVTISSTNSPSFSSFTQTLRQKNLNVKTLLSIGGGNSSPSSFAAMATLAARRKAFIDSSIKLARNYSFFGLDLDWEYPSSTAEMSNFGSLLTEWRSAVANESATSGKTTLLLTAAVFRNADYYSINYPVQAVSSSLDWINVMTYDYYGPSFAEGRTNTYPPAALLNGGSAGLINGDRGIVSWINAGISTKKIVIGLPFYGYAWGLVNSNNHGFFAAANGSAIGAYGDQGYNQIRALISGGYQRVYNATVVSDYCYKGTTWIGYDDTQSIAAKVTYAKGKSLLGYFAWHTGADTSTSTLSQTGYHYTGSGFHPSTIDSSLFTHLLCSFAYINTTSYHLSINSSTQHDFATFSNIVKLKNSKVTTLLSIWGGREDHSVLFSWLSQSSHKKSFIESSITTARLYEFDGLDLSGAVPRTKVHATSLGTFLEEWRAAVDYEASKSGKTGLLLTMALYNHIQGVNNVTYPIESIRKNINWVHLVAYDYYIPKEENFTHFHAALYDPISNWTNTNSFVKDLISRGLPASKLVLGLPYHGYGWTVANHDNNDSNIGAPASGPAVTIDGSMSYKYIKWFIKTYGLAPVYNDTYVVNYCTIGSIWFNFDDVEAISAKVSYAREMGLLGYNVFQVANDDNWMLSRAAAGEDGAQRNKKRLLAIVLVTATVIVILVGSGMCYLQRKVLGSNGILDKIKRSVYMLLDIVPSRDSFDSNSPNLQVFSYTTIKAATNNFLSQNKLGEGGFGPVYKGTLRKGQEIAVKRLSKTSHQGLEEFENEVRLTATLYHVNLVRVLGYCTKREEKMLIYEYMPNKSLDRYLFDASRWDSLHWAQRVDIIEGVIQGLLYLQEYSNSTIIHRDLKASNILLDENMTPKISDFGLARAFGKNEHEANTGHIVGTYGYVPPEYVKRGIYSMKFDVYSFGVLLLQIISGKRSSCYYGMDGNLNLLDYAYDLWKEGQGMDFVDPTLDDSTSSCKILRCMEVALLCVQENPDDRPSMLEVSSMLKSETVATVINPKKPAFSVRDTDENHQDINTFREEIHSVNDTTMSEIVPR